MALTLPRLTRANTRIPAIVTGVVIASALAWFGWQYFDNARPAPAAPGKPHPMTVANLPGLGADAAPANAGAARDKLIEDALVATGLKRQLEQLPQQLITGVRRSGQQQSKASPALVNAIGNALAESFTAKGFQDRVSAALKKNFDETRLQALLQDFSTPAAKRLIELQQAAPSSGEFARFARAATRPSSRRANLVKRIDAASRASDLAVDVAFSSMKALALGIVGAGAGKAAAVDTAIERQRASATQNIRKATLLNLAFSFRDASDADLEEYAGIYEAGNSKWFTDIVYAAMLEQVNSASAQAGEQIGTLAIKPAAPAPKPVRSKAGSDATNCLGLTANEAVIRCAEQYR